MERYEVEYSKRQLAKIEGINKAHAEDFMTALKNRKLCETSRCHYMRFLYRMYELWPGDWKGLTRKEVNRIVAKYSEGKSENTQVGFMQRLTVLVKWFEGMEWGSKGKPEICRDLTTSTSQSKVKTDDLIKPEEFTEILKGARTQKVRALLWVGYETGARAAEVALMNCGDILESGPDGVVVRIQTLKVGRRKTNNGTVYRQGRLVFGAGDLMRWLDQHPNPKKDSPLWTSKNHRVDRIGPRAINWALVDAAKHVKFPRRVWWHLFRHSRCSLLASRVSDAVLRVAMGWTAGSNMTGRYSHVRDKEADTEIQRALYGKEIKNGEDEVLSTRCPNCGALNLGQPKYCASCSVELSAKMRETVADKKAVNFVMDQLMQDPDVLKKITEIKVQARDKLDKIYGE